MSTYKIKVYNGIRIVDDYEVDLKGFLRVNNSIRHEWDLLIEMTKIILDYSGYEDKIK